MKESIGNLVDVVRDGQITITLELPSTDAVREIQTVEELYTFICQFGRVWVERIEGTNYYRVPCFKRGRDAYIVAKAKDCAIWGCE